MARLNRIGLGAARTFTVPCAAGGARMVAASFALEPCIGAASGKTDRSYRGFSEKASRSDCIFASAAM